MKKIIIDTVKDLIGDFLYYGRTEDEDLPRGAIEDAIEDGIISIDEIIEVFSSELKKGLF